MDRFLSPSPGLKLAAALLGVLVAAAAAADTNESAESFRGVVRMTALPNGNVQLALDEAEADGLPDGMADHLFILEHAESAADLDLTLADGVVTFAPGKLTLRAGSRLVLRWRLSDSQEAAVMKARRPADHPKMLIGSGISHHWGDFGIAAEELAVNDFFDDPEEEPVNKITPDGGGGVYCDSGGVGANLCSITCASGTSVSCTISCDSNKYACCNCFSSGAKCKCY